MESIALCNSNCSLAEHVTILGFPTCSCIPMCSSPKRFSNVLIILLITLLPSKKPQYKLATSFPDSSPAAYTLQLFMHFVSSKQMSKLFGYPKAKQPQFLTQTKREKYKNTAKILVDGCDLRYDKEVSARKSLNLFKLILETGKCFKESLRGGRAVKNLDMF